MVNERRDTRGRRRRTFTTHASCQPASQQDAAHMLLPSSSRISLCTYKSSLLGDPPSDTFDYDHLN